ncbi:NAD(P)/FAD-dependent oxidoreductase [Caulobacter segnis]|uniref:NAD(P)/FAD-dependent oxidoreductase n=1 Tax=Caulobacter segnis TaxID=88688 RepID=UPI001CC078F0|nr:FAD-dependent oxidoreductase [Caulobacter segnis]UAL10809.1 FAD-dependent oxidoreductase [Caulobacter segnis]
MIDRRGFLNLTAGGAATLAASAAGAQPKPGAPDVAVVGAGVFGAFTALSLRERGLSVLSLDQYGPVSPRASSSGETRSIRAGYGDQGFYSAWAMKALAMWKAREAEYGRTLLYPNARIELADRWTPGLTAQKAIFEALKLPYEVAPQAELKRRYPQMAFDDVDFAFVETTASAAVIKAREAVLATMEAFAKKGGAFRFARAVPGQAQGRRLLSLTLDGGEAVAAGQFVFACGPWASKLFPALAAPRVSVWRSEYFYFGTPAGDDRFSWPKQPAWHDHIAGGYGFGSLERGLKYSPEAGGRVTQDPDTAERLPTDYLLKKGRDYMGRRFPPMRDAPVMEARVCQVDNTANSHFVIDRHPDFDNVWLAFGGGGHGFKHGPMVGEYVADRLLGKAGDAETARLFSLAGHPAA